MKLVERFTRVDADTLEDTYTVIDPETWTSRWTACHEGNYSLANILAGQRAAEQEAIGK